MKKFFLYACVAAMLAACAPKNEKMNKCENEMLVRIAEHGQVAATRSHRTPCSGSYAADFQKVLT